MSGAGVRFSLFRGGTSEVAGGVAPGRDTQELWFALARRGWSSLVLVPADEGRSVARLATALAEVGGRLRDSPVTAIVADSMDYDSARMLADLQVRVHGYRSEAAAIAVESRVVDQAARAAPPSRDHAGPPAPHAQVLPPAGQVVVAIQPVVVEPLGVAVAHAADAVVLCVELGKTRMRSARRTIELIGAERISGAFLMR